MQYSPSCQTDSAGKSESARLKINSVPVPWLSLPVLSA